MPTWPSIQRSATVAGPRSTAVADPWPNWPISGSMCSSPEFHRVSWMLSAATRSSGASFVTTRKRLQRLVGDAAANALTAGLGWRGRSAGQSRPARWAGPAGCRGEIDRETFNRRYGHRGPHEFEISLPRPAEDPNWIDAAAGPARPERRSSYRGLLEAQERKRAAAWAELERRHPLQARMLHHQLRGWAKIARDRERARSEVIRYFWVLRAYVLRAGELTGLGDDIFFLDKAEIVRVLQGRDNQRDGDQASGGGRTSATRPCRPIPR